MSRFNLFKKLVKKNNAVILSINDLYAFAAANVIQCIEQYDEKLIDEYVIMHSGLCEKNMKALKKRAPCVTFSAFEPDVFIKKCPNFPLDTASVRHWSHLIFAKFEIFELTRRFHNCLFMDADLHPMASIREIFANGPLAWRPAAPSLSVRAKNYMQIPQEATMPNAGLVLVSDRLQECPQYTRICYELLSETYGKISEKLGQDEVIFGILNQKYALNAKTLPMIWNCPLGGMQTNKAKILHFMGHIKIWKNPLLWQMFPDFQRNVRKFIQLGGSFEQGEKILGNDFFSKNFTLLDSYNTVKNIIIWRELIGDSYLNLPEDIVMSNELSKSYLQFYIKGLPKEIHYELLQIREKRSAKIIAFHIERHPVLQHKGLKENFSKWVNNNKKMSFHASNEKLSIELLVKDTDVVKIFFKFIENTLKDFSVYLNINDNDEKLVEKPQIKNNISNQSIKNLYL